MAMTLKFAGTWSGGIQTDLVTFKLTYPAELDLSYFYPHVTYTCMSHVEVLIAVSRRGLSNYVRADAHRPNPELRGRSPDTRD